jgi:osmotically-inducible protein OsmY
MPRLIVLCVLPLLLPGCALFVLGAAGQTGISIAEERSLGTKVDDQVVYAAVNDQFVKGEHDGLVISATVNVRHGRVMLTGNVASEQIARNAVAAAWKAKGVKEVINHLIVNPNSTYAAAANDLLVKKNLVSRLIITKDVWYINYSTDVVAGNAYLLGYVRDRAELDRVLQLARTTKGVKKVYSHLLINAQAHRDAASTSDGAPVADVMERDVVPAPDTIDSNDITSPNYPTTAKPTWR